jgi:hypothetical protein
MQAFNPPTYYNGQMPIPNLNQYHSNIPCPSFRPQPEYCYVAPEYVKQAILKNLNRMPLHTARGNRIDTRHRGPVPLPRHSFPAADPTQLPLAPTSIVTAQANTYTHVFNETTYFGLLSHPPPVDIYFSQYGHITPEYQAPIKGAKRRARVVDVAEEDEPNTPSPTPCFSRAELEKESAPYQSALGGTASLLLCVNAKLKALYPGLAVDISDYRPWKSWVVEERIHTGRKQGTATVPIILQRPQTRPVPTTPLTRPEEWPTLEEAKAVKQITTRNDQTEPEPGPYAQSTAKGRMSDSQFESDSLPLSSMVMYNTGVKESKPRAVVEFYNGRTETQTRTPKKDRKKGWCHCLTLMTSTTDATPLV